MDAYKHTKIMDHIRNMSKMHSRYFNIAGESGCVTSADSSELDDFPEYSYDITGDMTTSELPELQRKQQKAI